MVITSSSVGLFSPAKQAWGRSVTQLIASLPDESFALPNRSNAAASALLAPAAPEGALSETESVPEPDADSPLAFIVGQRAVGGQSEWPVRQGVGQAPTEFGERTCHGGGDAATPRVPKTVRRDRHRLGPAKHEASGENGEDDRQNDRAGQFHVADRIQREQSPRLLRP